MSAFRSFPKNFLWGSAVSGHQIEGENHHSDWWHWELATPTQPHSGKAIDYWNRFKEDHDCLHEMGHQIFRMGIEWARVEPRENEFDDTVIEQYREIFTSLRKHNIKICLTLHHWVLPQWVAKKGGWTHSKTVEYFLRYVERMVQEFSSDPELWITFNEPMVAALAGYISADFPPQRRNFFAFRKAVRNMLKAHAGAYRIIHDKNPDARVGVANNYPIIEPWGSTGLKGSYERLFQRLGKLWFYQAWDESLQTGTLHRLFGKGSIGGLRDSVDFCGVNYYFRVTPRASLSHWKTFFLNLDARPEGTVLTDMGWQIHPEGIREVSSEVWNRFKKPIFITENGIADATDTKRAAYITEHLKQVHQAIQDGVQIEGYFHWSYIDNFEWNEGFDMKFGLVEVDQNDPDLQRIPRPSATLYSEIIRENGLTSPSSSIPDHKKTPPTI